MKSSDSSETTSKRKANVMANISPVKRPHLSQPQKKKSQFFGNKLLQSMENPDLIVKQSDLWVIIKDQYPKIACDDFPRFMKFLQKGAMYHWLVLPREKIPRITDLNSSHLPLLRSMHNAAEQMASEHKPHEFQIGYHAVPSMIQLHLHVISRDFSSPCLKTKKHWNSFTSAFFIPSETVIDMVEKAGSVHFDQAYYEGLLRGPLRCHKCGKEFKTIPNLKMHIETNLSDGAVKS